MSRNACLVRMPSLISPENKRVLTYFSGLLFAFGWWAFIDATVRSKHALPLPDRDSAPYDPIPVHISFADWTPGLCATIGMIIVSLVDKSHLSNDDGETSWEGGIWGGGVTRRAQLFLFIGLAFLAGGLAGSVTILIIKYVVPHYPQHFGVSYGVANVIQSLCIALSTTVSWIGQYSNSDYEYNLTL